MAYCCGCEKEEIQIPTKSTISDELSPNENKVSLSVSDCFIDEEIDDVLPFDGNGNYTGNNPAGIATTDQTKDENDPWSGTTFILRVFSEKNWNDFVDIMTVETLEGVKETLVWPIYEGRVVVYSNDDDSIVRTFTADEYTNAEISENFHIVRIAGEYYMVTYASEDNFLTISEIQLRPLSGYDGDASTENPDQMKYYTLKDFGL